MSATKAQINWTSVSFNSVSITRVTNASVGQGGQLIKFKGDTNIFPVIIANVDQEPHFSVTTADIGTMMGFAPGLTASLTASLNDALGASDGGIAFTLANAVFENADAQAQHAQFGTVTGTWQAFSSDGTTTPLSLAQY